MTAENEPLVKLTKRDLQSDQEVRWCPGCGDYAILSAVQSILPELGIPREKLVVVSGIGCSSRFPYYMNTFGFHSIHGRAPGIATGLKLARPDLDVWVITGDGDALSIGGNHLIHTLRRNIGLKILLFNNRIYGLTKGQYSPTSEQGKRTKSSPYGSLDRPFNPLALALGAGATFVARSVDVFQPHLRYVLKRAAEHRGTAFVEIYQNCNIFNDGAYAPITQKETRDDNSLVLEHGKPLIFGRERNKALSLKNMEFEIVAVDPEGPHEELPVWNETASSAAPAFLLAQVGLPSFPVPMGVFRAVDRPPYEQEVTRQIREQIERQGAGDLDELLQGRNTWTVDSDGRVS